MKKTIYAVSIIVIIGVFLVSCKKDWTCQCEVNNNSTYTYIIEEATEGSAQDACENNSQYSTNQSDTAKCSILGEADEVEEE